MERYLHKKCVFILPLKNILLTYHHICVLSRKLGFFCELIRQYFSAPPLPYAVIFDFCIFLTSPASNYRQAAVGFEPTHNGFANRRLKPLGYAAALDDKIPENAFFRNRFYWISSMMALTISLMASRVWPLALFVIMEKMRSPVSVEQTPENDFTPAI